jgi:hypothetical protein
MVSAAKLLTVIELVGVLLLVAVSVALLQEANVMISPIM